jgi:hypothetical protein
MNAERDVPHEFKLVEQLLTQQEVIMRALHYMMTNEKTDAERDDIIKFLKQHTQSRRERVFELPTISEDIDHVISEWEKECGENNRWVRALRAFAAAGGGIRWFRGYPHTGALMSFALLSPQGEELTGHRLKDIQDYAAEFTRSYVVRARVFKTERRELRGR